MSITRIDYESIPLQDSFGYSHSVTVYFIGDDNAERALILQSREGMANVEFTAALRGLADRIDACLSSDILAPMGTKAHT